MRKAFLLTLDSVHAHTHTMNMRTDDFDQRPFCISDPDTFYASLRPDQVCAHTCACVCVHTRACVRTRAHVYRCMRARVKLDTYWVHAGPRDCL